MDSVEITDPGSIDIMLSSLDSALVECTANEDYLSFSTILDIYLSKAAADFSYMDKEALLTKVFEILDENHELVYQIGWDLPFNLFKLIDSNWNPVFALKDIKGIVIIMNIFGLLAEYGNPKELLLTCSELISSLEMIEFEKDVTYIEYLKELKEDRQAEREARKQEQEAAEAESSEDDEDEDAEDIDNVIRLLETKPYRGFLIKFHCILELTTSCLKRNTTLYPSKFLSMIVVSIKQLLINIQLSVNTIPIIRRLYVFIRDYQPPSLSIELINANNSKNPDNLFTTKEFEDEQYLQRRLIIALFGLIVKSSTSHVYSTILTKYFKSLGVDVKRSNVNNYITPAKYPGMETVSDGQNEFFVSDQEYEFVERFTCLGYSYDLDFEKLFNKLFNDGNKVIDQIEIGSTNNETSTPGHLNDKLISNVLDIYKNSSLSNSSLELLPGPTVLLYMTNYILEPTQIYLDPQSEQVVNDPLKVFKFSLYMLTSQVELNENLKSHITITFVSSLLIILYNSLETGNLILDSLKTETIIKSTIQMFLFKFGNALPVISKFSSALTFFFTFFTKLIINISSANHNEASDKFITSFIFDTILNCPYVDFQIRFIQILKDILVNPAFANVLTLDKLNLSPDLVELIENSIKTCDLEQEQLSESQTSKLLSLINLSGSIIKILTPKDQMKLKEIIKDLNAKINQNGVDPDDLTDKEDDNKTDTEDSIAKADEDVPMPIALLQFNINTVVDMINDLTIN